MRNAPDERKPAKAEPEQYKSARLWNRAWSHVQKHVIEPGCVIAHSGIRESDHISAHTRIKAERVLRPIILVVRIRRVREDALTHAVDKTSTELDNE